MSEFTKGPIIVVDGGQDVFLKFPSGINICVGDSIYNKQRSLEIAHLLAAAPALYEALEKFKGVWESGPCSVNCFKDAYFEAISALSRARGESEDGK